jgi:hypothetical protein
VAQAVLVLAWLDDVIPGRAERKTAPRLGSDKARAALESPVGFSVVCYAALRHLGHDYAASCNLAAVATEEEQVRIYDVLFARRRYGPKGGGGEDLAESWWGPNVIAMADRFRTAIDAVGRLTLDQIDCYAGEGCEGENPTLLTSEQVDAMMAAKAEANGVGNGG